MVNSSYCHNGSSFIQKMFRSYILVLKTKWVQSCLHTFLLKPSYYEDDHEKNIN